MERKLPAVDVYRYAEPEKVEGTKLEFRLVYKGMLPAEKSRPRVDDKRRIRGEFHYQLGRLWFYSDPQRARGGLDVPFGSEGFGNQLVEIANRHKVVSKSNHIHKFVPLIGEGNAVSCALDILFLRRDDPGGVVRWGGDLDNRMKVLFDALRKPQNPEELEDVPQELPTFCLLEDDKYIDHVSITTDRLYTTLDDEEHIHEVLLIIHVKTVVHNFKTAHFSLW